MKITVELNLSEYSVEYLERVAKETKMTVTQVAEKYSHDPFILGTLADTFGPLVKRVHEGNKSKKEAI